MWLILYEDCSGTCWEILFCHCWPFKIEREMRWCKKQKAVPAQFYSTVFTVKGRRRAS